MATTDKLQNPANPPKRAVTEATRIPMSLPQQRLEVPEIPGYYLYWFLAENVERAQRAGYEFVGPEEVQVVNSGIADDLSLSGSTDMGSRVSQIAGGLIEGTAQPQRLYLMKLRQEWRDADAQKMAEENDKIARALRGGINPDGAAGAPSETLDDKRRRYLKQGQDLFFPKNLSRKA